MSSSCEFLLLIDKESKLKTKINSTIRFIISKVSSFELVHSILPIDYFVFLWRHELYQNVSFIIFITSIVVSFAAN